VLRDDGDTTVYLRNAMFLGCVMYILRMYNLVELQFEFTNNGGNSRDKRRRRRRRRRKRRRRKIRNNDNY
jgi:hypothetical protein